MEANKALAYAVMCLALAPAVIGCLDLDRPNTMPRRTMRPTAPRLTEVTGPPSAQANSSAPQVPPRVKTGAPLPVPAAGASTTKASDSGDLVSAPKPLNDAPPAPMPVGDVPPTPKQVASGGPMLVPSPPDEDAPPPVPAPVSRRPTKKAEANNEDPTAPPPIPSVLKPTQADNNGFSQLRALHRKAVDRYKTMDSYIVRLRRREQINGKDKPEELMLFKFRKKPFSVCFKWLGIQGHNREVIYVKGKHNDLIHTLLAEGDMPLMPAGKRMSLSPDNVFVRSASRHSITDAGIGIMVERFGKVLDAMEAGDHRRGTMKYLGPLKRPEFEQPFEAAEQAIPPDCEPQLAKGGSRLWLFDPESSLPLLLITLDHTNHEVEYYCYDRLQFPVRLDDDDFNPDKLWRHR